MNLDIEYGKGNDDFDEVIDNLANAITSDSIPLIEFGEGVLSEFFSKGDTAYGFHIFKVDPESNNLKATEHNRFKLLAEGEPLVSFVFPKTEKGISSIRGLIKWLETFQDFTEQFNIET